MVSTQALHVRAIWSFGLLLLPILLAFALESAIATGPVVQCQLNPRNGNFKLLPPRHSQQKRANIDEVFVPGIGLMSRDGNLVEIPKFAKGMGKSMAEKRDVMLPPYRVELVKPVALKTVGSSKANKLDINGRWRPTDPTINMEWVNVNNKDWFARRIIPGRPTAQWVEYHDYNTSFATFEEVKLVNDMKGAPVAILYDPTRSMLIRLDGSSVKWATGNPSDNKKIVWSNLSTGYWRKRV